MTKKKKDLSRIFTTDGGCVKTVFLIFFLNVSIIDSSFPTRFLLIFRQKLQVFQIEYTRFHRTTTIPGGLWCRERPTIDIYIPDIIELKDLKFSLFIRDA